MSSPLCENNNKDCKAAESPTKTSPLVTDLQNILPAKSPEPQNVQDYARALLALWDPRIDEYYEQYLAST